jgi:hypothetical protein
MKSLGTAVPHSRIQKIVQAIYTNLMQGCKYASRDTVHSTLPNESTKQKMIVQLSRSGLLAYPREFSIDIYSITR